MERLYAFEEADILVQPSSDNLGPFTFDLSPQLQDGMVVDTIEVKTYKGRNSPVETTSYLVDPDFVPVVVSNVVSVKFKWPGASYKGSHKITFIYSTVCGFADEADHWRVLVQDV